MYLNIKAFFSGIKLYQQCKIHIQINKQTVCTHKPAQQTIRWLVKTPMNYSIRTLLKHTNNILNGFRTFVIVGSSDEEGEKENGLPNPRSCCINKNFI